MFQAKASPCDSYGMLLGEDEYVEDPQELLTKSFSFKFHIDQLLGLNKKYSQV